MPRKPKAVRNLEEALERALESQRLLHHQMSVKDTQHKQEIERMRASVAERKLELATKLVNAIGQAQEAVARPLAMLFDTGGL